VINNFILSFINLFQDQASKASNALTSVEERLSNLLQESSMLLTTPIGRQDDGRLLVPDHMGWIVTMWHATGPWCVTLYIWVADRS
jgi:hypothetical protein